MIDITGVPGVLGVSLRSYVNIQDVMKLLGCQAAKASRVIKKINDDIEKSGGIMFPAGKANKYVFSEMTKIPLEDIDNVIRLTDGEKFEKLSEKSKATARKRKVG